jgi:hypothetical protein
MTALLAVAGLFVLFQPFSVSPWTCASSGPGNDLVIGARRCLEFPDSQLGFVAALVLGAVLVVAAVWSAVR